MKIFSILCALALVVGIATAAYADTQSIKVSGDLTVRGIVRDAYTFDASPTENSPVLRAGADSPTQTFFMSTTELQVDADMTDNVSAVVRLVNQRDWNRATKAIMIGTRLNPNGRCGYTPLDDEFDVAVDLAYVELKDFIYSPLTLTVGRQDIWIGKGFIVGANQQNIGNVLANDVGGELTAPEYTAINSFDAAKAVLDYDPWTITGIFAKIEENVVGSSDDVTLYGVNVGYVFDVYKADIEGYWFNKDDQQVENWAAGDKHGNDVHAVGARTTFDPIDVLTIDVEGAYQFGRYVGTRRQTAERERSAYAFDIAAEWRYLMDKYAWKPKLGGEIIIYSGNEEEENPDVVSGDYTGWDPMYRGKFDSAIREFTGRYYVSAMYPQLNTAPLQSSPDAAFTNQQQYIIKGTIEPIETVTVNANYNLFCTMQDIQDATGTTHDGIIGQEIDVVATWDYTEDVTFGILGAWFFPHDDVYANGLDDHATDVVGTMTVSF